MNIIFITLSNINGISERGIYADLLRKFRDKGHKVCIVSPSERRNGEKTHVIEGNGVTILKVRTLNIQKTNVVEKGIGTLMIEGQFKRAIKKHLGDVKFDLILYSTPPITFTNVVRYLKKQNPQAISYLLLKDIFPQNAVDIRLMPGSWFTVKGSGLRIPIEITKLMLYKHFRRKEIDLYKASDYIGCMSPANVEYIRKHNTYYPAERVEVAPNSISLNDNDNVNVNHNIREKYGLPTDKPVFIYGGNLGKPQGIPFLIKCLEANKDRKDCHFLIVGNGTEYNKLHTWHESLNEKLKEKNEKCNITLMQRLPKEDYDQLVRSCDVGLIFLDHRFTIPNYPSRLLSYLEYSMPVLCATDRNTDIGRIAKMNGYGLWCESVNEQDFTVLVNWFVAHPEELHAMGKRGHEYLKQNYLVENTYRAIVSHL